MASPSSNDQQKASTSQEVAEEEAVEAEAEELEALFPGIRYTLAASDTIHSPRAAEELVRSGHPQGREAA